MGTLGDSAVALCQRGLRIFPCQPKRKEPACPHGHLDATDDVERVREWWSDNPDFNVAIATGEPSGVFAVDIDDAEPALAALEEKFGALPATVESITARGRHLFFKCPAVPIRNSASKIAPDIDVRGTGGYVLVPPSIHPSGKAYAWSVDCARAFAEAPAWLVELAKGGAASCRREQQTDWAALIDTQIPEGSRNDTVARLAGTLIRGMRRDVFFVAAMLFAWNEARCAPPLDREEIEDIVTSVARTHARNYGLPT